MKCFIETERLNYIPHLNDYLDAKNSEMEIGDRYECHAITAQHEREKIMDKWPIPLSYIVILWEYFWHDICAKLRPTRKLYFYISGGRHRTYSRTEILGRICRAGFRIINEFDKGDEHYILVEKNGEPLPRNKSCVSPILYLERVGKNRQIIKVYKFRTMHSYAQYLQEYVYERNSLREGGKLADDFRVNIWGKVMRRLWLDELPMIWNMLKGDLKLVGVRPLSEHYFSLYTPEMQELRTRVKPGLFPPFYYERQTPQGLDEIQDSERRYVESYLKHPFRTDMRYFWGSIFNILFRLKRSH